HTVYAARVSRLLFVCALMVAGCASAYQEIGPGEKKAREAPGLSLTSCGASTATMGSVIKTMDEPPIGPGGGEAAKPTPMFVCFNPVNHGDKPARVDRSHLRLDTPHAHESWVPDKDDEVFVVPPGEQRRFTVEFDASMLVSGEDVKVRLDDAI